jgi:hypothetical protein
MKINKLALAIAGCLLSLATQTSRANSMTYSLNQSDAGISAYPGPYGSVMVNLTAANQATITFTGNTVGTFEYLFGGQGSVAVNVNASSFSVSGFSGFTSPGVTSGNEDGFGVYNLTIDNFDGNGAASANLSFVLTDNSGTWASASSVLTGNAGGWFVGAHIFVDTTSGGNPATGYAAGNTGTPTPAVPDGGATAIMLGSVLGGLGIVGRRLRKS